MEFRYIIAKKGICRITTGYYKLTIILFIDVNLRVVKGLKKINIKTEI